VPPLNDKCLKGRVHARIRQQAIKSYGIATAKLSARAAMAMTAKVMAERAIEAIILIIVKRLVFQKMIWRFGKISWMLGACNPNPNYRGT
jgi:hypothetical protein